MQKLEVEQVHSGRLRPNNHLGLAKDVLDAVWVVTLGGHIAGVLHDRRFHDDWWRKLGTAAAASNERRSHIRELMTRGVIHDDHCNCLGNAMRNRIPCA